MTCTRPLPGWFSKVRNPETGKRSVVFSVSEALVDRPVQVPCGQCLGCRQERSRQWAIRCSHEAALYDDNCFLTLTYADDALPANGSLVLQDYQQFLKRLRERVYPQKIRFFGCGEYGATCRRCGKSRKFCRCRKFDKILGRPHYHLIVFNYRPGDLKFYKQSGPNQLFTSPLLEKVWPYGFNTVGQVSFGSAAYVASYTIKKRTGYMSRFYYCDYDDVTGEIYNEVLPEFGTMSLKPGIGAGWFEKFKKDVFPSDQVIVNGKAVRVPRYYDKLVEVIDHQMFRKIRQVRMSNASDFAENNTSSRHRIRETVAEAKTALYKRSFEDDG